MQSRTPVLDAWINWRTLTVLLLAMPAFINAAAYISYAGIPFVTSDGWYFVDAFLQKHYHAGLSLQDFYVKRSADDHAQPVQKLLLLWNAEAFNLDFVIESYMGLAIAAVAWLLMLHVMAMDNRGNRPGIWWLLPAVASAASFVSLSGGMVFNWSLVTLGYLGPLAATALAVAAWTGVEKKRWWPLVAVAALVAFTQDGTAVICAISVICALLLRELKLRGTTLRPTAVAVAVVAGWIVAYKLASSLYLHAGLPVLATGGQGVSALLDMGVEPIARMMLTIAALSVSDLPPLQLHFPGRGELLHLVLGAVVIASHAWFWWRAVRDRWNSTQFLAVVLMLFCYGAVAGIIITRVSMFGPGYASQQRYLMLYQLGTVAIALLSAGSNWRTWGLVQKGLVSIGLLGLIAAQLPLSRATWSDAPYVQVYGNNLGRQMILLGANPQAKLAACAPTLVICEAENGERIRSITLLRDHHLNAYSAEMLGRYSMEAIAAPTGPMEVVTPADDASKK